MIDCAQLTDLSRSSGAVARRGRDRLLAFYPIALKSLEKNEGMLELLTYQAAWRVIELVKQNDRSI
jgi:hypothetical protein